MYYRIISLFRQMLERPLPVFDAQTEAAGQSMIRPWMSISFRCFILVYVVMFYFSVQKRILDRRKWWWRRKRRMQSTFPIGSS